MLRKGTVTHGPVRAEFINHHGINSGSQPLTSGRGASFFFVRDVMRRGFFDHLELYWQV
ncbi:MAG: hypothetical protein AB8H86_09740 [Polyangiales bacterium]